jgi:signal transduction histidine kinase
MRLRASLFFKIYATLLAALIILSMLLGALWRFSLDRPDPADRFPRRIAEAILPEADAPAPVLIAAIHRLAVALDAEISLRGPDGRRLAFVGDPEAEPTPRGVFGNEKRVWRVNLSDGRTLIARFEVPLRPPGWRMLLSLLLAAVAVAIAGLPVIWLLTRRLKRLRQSVDAFGEGKLDTRADVRGSDEVAVLAKSFNHSAERIEALIGAHRALLANASHELRSPLTRLRLAIDLQSERPTVSRQDEIIRNLSEIDALIEEILLASRLARPEIQLVREQVDLSQILSEEAERLSLPCEAGDVRVQGDGVLLRRLIRNLLENAAAHGAAPIEASLQRSGDQAVLTVRDHGKGIAEADRERIFEPFFRPAGRSESSGGWGLGLSLVKQIATRHGGSIRCAKADGGGAVFTFQMKRA